MGFGVGQRQAQILALLLSSFPNLSKLFTHSLPSLSYLSYKIGIIIGVTQAFFVVRTGVCNALHSMKTNDTFDCAYLIVYRAVGSQYLLKGGSLRLSTVAVPKCSLPQP